MNSIKVILKRPLYLALIILGLILLAVLPRFVQPYSLISLITILMYVILTLSWALFSGPTRYISLATAAFFGVGVYTTAIGSQQFSLPILAMIGGLISFVLAFLIGLLTLRLKGIYFILFTFGVSALIRHALLWWETHVTLTVGRWVIGPGTNTVYYYILGIFGLTLLTAYFIRQSRFGLALNSIGENEEAAAHIGINVTMLKTVTFAISAFFMGAAGAIMATRWTYIDPGIAFNPLISFLPVLMAIFGGTSRLIGPILGAAIFTILQELLITQYPYYYMLIFGITLIVVILFLPEGIVGLIDKGNWHFKRVPGAKKMNHVQKEVNNA